MQEDLSAAARALVAHRKRAAGNCVRCGAEFPPSYAGKKHKRLYCSRTCRQYAYQERKAAHTPTPPASEVP
jgi:hypothetical protein